MIAVDASVAAKWIFPEEYSAQARALLRATLQAREPIVSPPLLPIEVTNIVRQRMRREGLTLFEGQRRLALFLTLPVTLHATQALHGRALEIADRHGLPAAYDAHYVALAELSGCALWTDDQRLLNTLAGSLPFVRWIASYPLAGRS
jgi:predicted nucleic acid-binding protein